MESFSVKNLNIVNSTELLCVKSLKKTFELFYKNLDIGFVL